MPPARATTAAYGAEIDKAREFCEALEIGRLRVDTVMPPQEMSPEEYEGCFAQLATSWADAARRCGRSGVTLVWEFEPGFWLNRPGEVERLAKEVGDDNFGILFDSSHAYTGGVRGARQGGTPELMPTVATYATRLLPFIRHLHLADADGRLHDEDTSVHTPLGQGRVDFALLLAALSPIADRLDWWCVDMCYCDGADEKAARSLDVVRSWARPVALQSGGQGALPSGGQVTGVAQLNGIADAAPADATRPIDIPGLPAHEASSGGCPISYRVVGEGPRCCSSWGWAPTSPPGPTTSLPLLRGGVAPWSTTAA